MFLNLLNNFEDRKDENELLVSLKQLCKDDLRYSGDGKFESTPLISASPGIENKIELFKTKNLEVKNIL